MSETTLQVPTEHLEAIRQALIGRCEDSSRRGEAESLLAQLAGGSPGDGPHQLTGSRALIWAVVYDSLCGAAERLADECNDYWRGVVEPSAVRATIASVSTRLEMLLGLGPPPAD